MSPTGRTSVVYLREVCPRKAVPVKFDSQIDYPGTGKERSRYYQEQDTTSGRILHSEYQFMRGTNLFNFMRGKNYLTLGLCCPRVARTLCLSPLSLYLNIP